MPPEESVSSNYISGNFKREFHLKGYDEELVRIFRREYAAASRQLKDHALNITDSYEERQRNFVLSIYGEIDGEFYCSHYYITKAFPESYAFLKQYESYEPQYDNEYDEKPAPGETTLNE